MARILMLVNQFSARDAPPDPPRELADAFVALGHLVKVVVIPWQQRQERVQRYVEHPRLEVIRVPRFVPTALGRLGSLLVRWTVSPWIARWHAARFLANDHFDVIYTTSPASALASLLRWALRRFHARSYLYVVDFFPFHQRAIGLVPGGPIFRAALARERALIRRFDVIGCMSPRNIAYLRAHYPLRPQQQVALLPLATKIAPRAPVDRESVRGMYGLPADKSIAIFGGQITDGRGIEQILMTAALAREQLPQLQIVLVGRGRLVHLVERYIAARGANVTYIAALSRDDYLALAAACDIGLVVTVPIADIPTFPSKTLDYLQAGLPVVAAVERDTDFGPFVMEHGFGLAVEAGQPDALLGALAALIDDPARCSDMAAAGARALREVFDVRVAAERIIAQALTGTEVTADTFPDYWN